MLEEYPSLLGMRWKKTGVEMDIGDLRGRNNAKTCMGCGKEVNNQDASWEELPHIFNIPDNTQLKKAIVTKRFGPVGLYAIFNRA